MFTPFSPGEALLDQAPFIRDEVRFNLVHKIAEDPEAILLKDVNNMLAAQNPGRRMWLWIDESLGQATTTDIIHSLCRQLKDSKLPGVAARPEQAAAFAAEYARLSGTTYSEAMGLVSYHCPKVVPPQGVAGRMISPSQQHRETIADFCTGFILDGFGKTVTKESQLGTAERLINSGNLFLWEVDGTVVCMSNLAHRSKRHGRINNVYTPPEHRKNGYASALVAELSNKLLAEGLIPMLYADVKTPASNKVYKSIGYKECGLITEIDFR